MLRVNDNDLLLSLDGDWRFRLGNGPETTLNVPGVWEAATGDLLTDGPGLYSREVELGPEWAGRRIWLEVDAASFASEIYLNDIQVGRHNGMWSPFQVELTGPWRPGRNTLRVEIWKPGRKYPVREALAGFLPDVCTTFGGLWQSVRLRGALPETPGFIDLRWLVEEDGSVTVDGRLAGRTSEPMLVVLEVGGHRVERPRQSSDGTFELTARGAIRNRYSARAPRLTSARLTATLADGSIVARAERRLGRRWFAAQGATLTLNGRPAHLRGVLDWGWEPGAICPRIHDPAGQFAKARALGFNLFKCCLYVPTEDFLDQADAAGMWIWLEMPLWLPSTTPRLEALALAEYEAVFKRLHHHPSIAVVTLGCELNHATGVDFLHRLDDLARRYLPGVLVGDNSGSAEAYGGVRTGLGDFVDYHFYTEPHFFGQLVAHFDRPHRPPQPWLYGEFCDADTLRDFAPVREAWWLTTPGSLQRDDHIAQREHATRFARAGVTDSGQALTAIARRQATAIRKHILERVRRRDATGGYVVTGWRDTPITTSGLVDDSLKLKFEPAAWRAFNADRILVLDRERRRLWEGGDRPSPREPYTFWAREAVELTVALANGGRAAPAGRLAWHLRTPEGVSIARGVENTVPIPGGSTRDLATFDLTLPDVVNPTALWLEADWAGEAAPVANTWRLLTLPRPKLPGVVAVEGLQAHRADFRALWPATRFVALVGAPTAAPLLTDQLSASVVEAARGGRHVLIWLTDAQPELTVSRPFWREAIHEHQPGRFSLPAIDHLDLTAHGIATDWALSNLAALATTIGDFTVNARPWRRFDARRMDWCDYWVDAALGLGAVSLTTLRLAGGLGEQPARLATNPLGAWLLAQGLRGPIPVQVE